MTFTSVTKAETMTTMPTTAMDRPTSQSPPKGPRGSMTGGGNVLRSTSTVMDSEG